MNQDHEFHWDATICRCSGKLSLEETAILGASVREEIHMTVD